MDSCDCLGFDIAVCREVNHQVVNKRVYFLIKKRLSNEIDRELPLFPWETEVEEYAEDDPNQPVAGNDKSGPPIKAEPPPPK
jgi:hypothetical protein